MTSGSLFNSTNLTTPQTEASSWHADPARLSFLEYRDRSIWGPPGPDGTRPCLDRKLLSEGFWYTVSRRDNEYSNGEDPEYGSWPKVLACGRSYMVGTDVSMFEFLRRHSSSLTKWQKQAFHWCLANPSVCLEFESRPLRRKYQVKKRGEYVEISLPHHEWGGERSWISRDGKRKVLINVD